MLTKIKLVLGILFCFFVVYSQAKGTDSLYNQFKVQFLAEKADGNKFMQSMFNASEKTLSIENPLMRRAMLATGLKDTAALRTVNNAVVSRFIDEDLISLACNRDLGPYMEAIELCNRKMCDCLTSRIKNQSDSRLSYADNREVDRHICSTELKSDSEFVKKVKSLLKDPDELAKISPCISLYMTKMCPLMRNDAIVTCYLQASAAYDKYKKKLEQAICDNIKGIMNNEKEAGKESTFIKNFKDAALAKRCFAALKKEKKNHGYAKSFAVSLDRPSSTTAKMTFWPDGDGNRMLFEVDLSIAWAQFAPYISKFKLQQAKETRPKSRILGRDEEEAPPMKEIEQK